MKGDTYLGGELRLSLFDALGILLALEGKEWCESAFCLPPSGKAAE